MQAKNWLFEAALEAGEINTAICGFEGVRGKTSSGSRVHLEATALLAICYLRLNELDEAKQYIRFVFANVNSAIGSESRRREFRTRIIARFDQETAFATLRNEGIDELDPAEIEVLAGQLVATTSEDDLLKMLADAIPEAVVFKILEIDTYARRLIPEVEVRYLPSPEGLKKKEMLGRTVFTSFKVALYRSLCDPECDVYKAWFTNGMACVLDKKYIGAAVTAMLLNAGIGVKMIAVTVTALIFRFGIEVYCERYRPEGVMLAHDGND